MTHPKKDTTKPPRNSGDIQRPTEFMRMRRPYLFSDTRIDEERSIPRAVLEYHLDSLTNRKQETDFEHFCWRLAEKEICPNLLPQTGPTGGGDSKTDSENYPVADAIASRWYDGIGREASSERWAFAFSAKKQWRPKVRSDVEKVVATSRGYAKAFFFSNQFISDKDRAAMEDELSKKHGISVRIFDRSWIVDRVYSGDHIELAVEALNMVGFDVRERKIAGPEDTLRKTELDEIEQHIRDTDRYPVDSYALAEDCLRAAVLARGLGHPRTEVEGMFERAKQVAGRVGVRRQKLRVAYQHAWTTIWWFDDFTHLDTLYTEVEALTVDSEDAADYEQLTNLWLVLYSYLRRKSEEEANKRASEITRTLRRRLEQIVANKALKNNSLWGRKNLLCVELVDAAANNESNDHVLREFIDLLKNCDGLAQVPIESTLEMIRELGEYHADSEAYDELFAVVLEVSQSRKNEGETGLLLLERGQQKLKAGKTYEAIRWLGQAEQKLPMEEYREPWVVALGLCGVAYGDAGLPWAARSNILAAINVEATSSTKEGAPSYWTLILARKLTLIELQLGRIFPALAWLEFGHLVLRNLKLTNEQTQRLDEELTSLDYLFSILLLRTEFADLQSVGFLPSILEKMGLPFSCATLLYLLGQIDVMRTEGFLPDNEDETSLMTTFSDLVQHPVGQDLPSRTDLSSGDSAYFLSMILGCEVRVTSHSDPSSIALAETILGATEALLATSLDLGIFAHRSEIGISVRPSEYVSDVPNHWIDNDENGIAIHVRHPTYLRRLTMVGDPSLLPWLQTLILDLSLQIIAVDDPETFAEQLFGREGGFSRALSFSAIEVAIRNTLGSEPKLSRSHWAPIEVPERYTRLRSVPWNHELLSKMGKPAEPTALTLGDPPSDDRKKISIDGLKHNQIRVKSLIDIDLWNKANWKANAYVVPPDTPPILALGFANHEAARLIFAQWQKRLGPSDLLEHIRLTIITGTHKSKPNRYRVVVSANPQLAQGEGASLVMYSARILNADPPDQYYLNQFISRFRETGEYAIVPSLIASDDQPPAPLWELAITKKQLVIREAWTIGANDLDVAGIQEDDDPILPMEVETPPVLEALARFERRRKK